MTLPKKLTIAFIGLVLIMIAVTINNKNDHKTKQTNNHVNTSTPCTINPCIEITESGGNHYRFNDFRFGPQGCIWYSQLSNHKWVEYCGGYNLNWIGPGNPPGKEGKI